MNLNKRLIWECACGEGHLAKRLVELGYTVWATDLVDRGYGEGGVDFLEKTEILMDADIITNPPYKYAQEFVEKAMQLLTDGNSAYMFLKLQFLEGQKRGEMFEKYPPKTVYVSRKRILCAKNGDFDRMRAGGGSAVAYGWYHWEKGFRGDPSIKWVN